LTHLENIAIVTSKKVHCNVLLPKTKCIPWYSTRSWHPHEIGNGVYQYKWLWESHLTLSFTILKRSNLSSTPCGFGTCALTLTTRKHGTFLLINLVKKYPIRIGVKKNTSSFWTSQFRHVCCDWVNFFDLTIWLVKFLFG
jgi:hypothetical protein